MDITEGLTIVGGAALRPVGLLLYDPWVLRRDITLYRLETADVSETPGA